MRLQASVSKSLRLSVLGKRVKATREHVPVLLFGSFFPHTRMDSWVGTGAVSRSVAVIEKQLGTFIKTTMGPLPSR